MPFSTIISGDTHKTTVSDSNYSTSLWSLKYHLVGPSTLTVDATVQGTEFLVTLSANQTSVLKPGIYQWALRASYSGESYTIASGMVTVKPNPASGTARIFIAQRMVELIEKALTGQLEEGEAIEALSISGRSITMINRSELMEERAMWYQEIEAFKRAQNGGSAIRSIRIDVGRL